MICGPSCFSTLTQRAERHHLALAVAHLEPADVVGLEPEPLVGLHADLVGPAEQVEVVDVGRAERRLQRAEDAVERHAQGLGLHAIDVGVDAAARRRGTCVLQRRQARSARCRRAIISSATCWSSLEPDAAAVLELHLEAARHAEAVDRPAAERRRSIASWISPNCLRSVPEDRVLAQARAAGPLLPGRRT